MFSGHSTFITIFSKQKKKQKKILYRIYSMYSDRQGWANSVDPDEMHLIRIYTATHSAIFRYNIG